MHFGTDPLVRRRQAVEARVVRRIVSDLLKAGYALSVSDGEYGWLIRRSTNKAAILHQMMEMDEDNLTVFTTDGVRVGGVYFVYGNDGWDVVNDYSVALEHDLAPAMRLCETLEGVM